MACPSVRYLLLVAVACLVLQATALYAADAPKIYAYHLTAPGCPHCEAADRVVEEVVKPDPQVELRVIDTHDPEGFAIADAMLAIVGIEPGPQTEAPGLLVGDTLVENTAFSAGTVRDAIDRYRKTGAPDLYERALEIKQAREALPHSLRKWGVLTVIGAGLLDGINPCAFATLVFFMSYLGFAGASTRRLALVGLLFAAGVFAAYFAFGVGLLHAVMALDSFPLARRIIYGLIGGACLVFVGLSVHDHVQLVRGNDRAVKLQLPALLKRQAHRVIREGVGARLIAPAAFIAGAGVSVLEIACTGQVYVPAIMYMVSVSATRKAALGWLLLYDVCFIAPLLVLLGLALAGTSSKHLAAFAEKQASSTKLLLAVFFLLCAAFFIARAAGINFF